MKKESRVYGIDIIKIIAVILVFSLHFFRSTGYYNISHFGIGMKL